MAQVVCTILCGCVAMAMPGVHLNVKWVVGPSIGLNTSLTWHATQPLCPGSGGRTPKSEKINRSWTKKGQEPCRACSGVHAWRARHCKLLVDSTSMPASRHSSKAWHRLYNAPHIIKLSISHHTHSQDLQGNRISLSVARSTRAL